MQIKCKNVVILAATNVDELETEWGCLLDTQESGLVMAKSFVSKHLCTSLLDVCLFDSVRICFVFILVVLSESVPSYFIPVSSKIDHYSMFGLK